VGTNGNAEAIEAWNTVLFEKFSRFREIVTTGLGAHGQALIARHPPRSGARVLDVGCGFGDLTTELAARVGGAGQAVGVDAAARFVDAARGEASAAGVRNATFEVRDVEREPLGGPFQHAFSRFGTMFFASPVAALRNVARALAPDGELAMVVWRRREDNPWVHLAEERVRALVAEPEEHRAVTCGPARFPWQVPTSSATSCSRPDSATRGSSASICRSGSAVISTKRSSSGWRSVPRASCSASRVPRPMPRGPRSSLRCATCSRPIFATTACGRRRARG
jgi:ubiquinone/menaquinone biosynthesis C-methylase UbiE